MDNLAGSLRGLLGDFLDFVYPSHCGVCGCGLRRGEKVICEACWQGLQKISDPFCQRCGLPLSPADLLCAACEARDHLFSFARSYALFDETFQKIIHLFKYRRKLSLAASLAGLMAHILRIDSRFSPMEVLIPVPLHSAKRRARGYNQSELLARNLSRITGWPLVVGILNRRVNTRSQSQLRLAERMVNVRDAFRIRHPQRIRDRRIVLVDDVLTTGSTTDACALALLEAGAAQVSVITAARAAEPEPLWEGKKGQS